MAWACGSLDFQKRGRLRRTYQFDRSSTNRASRVAPRRASKPSSLGDLGDGGVELAEHPAVEHVVGAGTPARSSWPSAGRQPSRSAYVTKKLKTFHSVSSVWRVDSRMPSS